MELLYYWIAEIALVISGAGYVHSMERRERFWIRLSAFLTGYVVIFGVLNLFPITAMLGIRILIRVCGFGSLVFFLYFCWQISWTVAVYDAIWAYISCQMMYEIWVGIRLQVLGILLQTLFRNWTGLVFIFVTGNLLIVFTISDWISDGVVKKIGPRQLLSALLLFSIFEIIGFELGNVEQGQGSGNWAILYLSQLLLALILYLQNELFKKSAMRQELAVMNLLWKKEQEQYRLSRENIALINQKCHDLKHQIRAIRSMQGGDMEEYLREMENTVQIYEAIVKTGNEVLDTILTEKSLYCREHGIVVSCVADGSQMQFINTVDLYAILGNALDNAIEAVEKFEQQEKRQIDVLIYRQKNFLVMNIINPLGEHLVYEEELPVSTKGDHRFHGFGLRSIRYLVKKYDGCVSISGEDGCFSLKILIPIPQAT